jgi:membrane protein implicated in regulation of membrane protease activity
MNLISVWLSELTLWHWIILALLLVIAEVSLGANFVLLWCALMAGVIGVIVALWPNLAWEYQFLLFGVGILMSLWLGRWQMHQALGQAVDRPYLNQRANQYLNRVFTLEEPIENGIGRVRVDDSLWRVQGPELEQGTQVKVIGVNGTILKVQRYYEEN